MHSLSLQTIPREVQLNLLTYLRAYDLSAVQLTCRFYNDADLIDSLVHYVADHVYSPEYTKNIVKPEKGKENVKYTLEDLRDIELTVVARILSLPEPKQGFYVSKAWVKKTLLWLETVNEPPRKKKLNKKQQRQRDRRLSDVSPPWPNANSDLLCCHQNLQRCGVKAARSRRRLMDKQAWKILKKLYPDSTQLDSMGGECLQCRMETETSRKNEHDRLEQEKLERKQPLGNPLVRRFYTRTRGAPTDCLFSDDSDTFNTSTSEKRCPLKSGTYVVIPRAWCHQWRRYMKTGEGSTPLPPDSSALLCDAHKYALLPPHLEAFLDGSTPQLLWTITTSSPSDAAHIPATSPGTPASLFTPLPVGVQPTLDLETANAMAAAGLSPTEVATQRMAMLQLQQEQQQAQATPTLTRSDTPLNDMLDRENHVVVELATEAEWAALRETGFWPIQLGHAIRVTVKDDQKFHFSTHPCRECDPTGSRFLACAEVKYRRKRWEPKSVEQKRIPRVEY